MSGHKIEIVNSFKEAQCDGCGKLPVNSARLKSGIRICWGCAYAAFDGLEALRNPEKMYLSEDGRLEP